MKRYYRKYLKIQKREEEKAIMNKNQNEPREKMNKQELIANSYYKGNIILWNRDLGRDSKKVDYTITHYFDTNLDEIGFIAFAGTKFESIKIFEPKRIWDESFIKKYEIVEINLPFNE